jgi:hypothetical protein
LGIGVGFWVKVWVEFEELLEVDAAFFGDPPVAAVACGGFVSCYVVVEGADEVCHPLVNFGAPFGVGCEDRCFFGFVGETGDSEDTGVFWEPEKEVVFGAVFPLHRMVGGFKCRNVFEFWGTI